MSKLGVYLSALLTLALSMSYALAQDCGRIESVGPLEVKAVYDSETGLVRLYNYMGDEIACLGRDGGHNDPWEADPFFRVFFLRIGEDKLVYVSDAVEKTTYVFNYSGELIRRITHSGHSALPAAKRTVYMSDEMQYAYEWGGKGNGDGQFDHPYGITLDNSGNVYVSDCNNHRIQVFGRTGRFIRKWGSEGSGNGHLDRPHGISMDSSGNAYVADCYNHRIQVFSSTGRFISGWGSNGSAKGQFKYPKGIVLDDTGNIYVADCFNHRIQVFSDNGWFIRNWGGEGSGNGQFSYPVGIALDASDYIYVTSRHRIQVFDNLGFFIRKWGREGSGDGQFKYPKGIILDNAGNIYVADSYNFRIQVFDNTGRFIKKWGSQGSGDGEFNHPHGIGLDNSGNIYVTDYDNHRIQVFSECYINNGPSVKIRGKISGELAPADSSITARVEGRDTNSTKFYAEVTVSNNGKFIFSKFPRDSAYKMTIHHELDTSLYTLTPRSISGTANSNVNVVYNLNKAATIVNLIGTVTTKDGTPLQGVTITKTTGGVAITDSQGNYSLEHPCDSSVILTPSKEHCRFEPPNRGFEVTNENIFGLDFTAIAQPYITSLSPPDFTPDALAEIERDLAINGGNFQNGLTLSSDNTQVTIFNIQVISAGQISCKIKIPSKANKGWYKLTVINSDGERSTKDNAFEIR